MMRFSSTLFLEPVQVLSVPPPCISMLLCFYILTLSAVLDFLSQLPGWDTGLVRCSGVALRGCDGRVCGFEQDGQHVWQEEEEVHNHLIETDLRGHEWFPVTAN